VEVCGQLHAPAALSQGKSPWYLLDRRLGGPQSQSGRGGKEKNSQPLPGLEYPIIQPVAQRYTTELSRLLTVIHVVKKLRIVFIRTFHPPSLLVHISHIHNLFFEHPCNYCPPKFSHVFKVVYSLPVMIQNFVLTCFSPFELQSSPF
jgi:hypothetical protein